MSQERGPSKEHERRVEHKQIGEPRYDEGNGRYIYTLEPPLTYQEAKSLLATAGSTLGRTDVFAAAQSLAMKHDGSTSPQNVDIEISIPAMCTRQQVEAFTQALARQAIELSVNLDVYQAGRERRRIELGPGQVFTATVGKDAEGNARAGWRIMDGNQEIEFLPVNPDALNMTKEQLSQLDIANTVSAMNKLTNMIDVYFDITKAE